MPSRKRLSNGILALYPDNRVRKARRYVEHYTALGHRFDLTDALVRDFAAATADAWASWRAIKAELEAVEGKRERGRGRRPNRQAVERLRRREGLQWQKYEGSLRRLEELAIASRKP